jgi:hypothetical protein
LRVDEKLAINVAGFVIATGAPVMLRVVNVLSPPKIVPALLVATIRKWYVVLAVKPVILALTGTYVFPLRFCIGVVEP